MNAAALMGSAATVFETGVASMLPREIRPLSVTWRLEGPASTVQTAPGHNLWLHRAVYAASPGSILMVSTTGGPEFGYWGDILTAAAMERRLGGLVIDGCVRDCAELLRLGFPIFARGLCVRGTGKDAGRGSVGEDVQIGETWVHSGDVVVGDADGVVVVPSDQVATASVRARKRDDAEDLISSRILAGERTLDIYGWPKS